MRVGHTWHRFEIRSFAPFANPLRPLRLKAFSAGSPFLARSLREGILIVWDGHSCPSPLTLILNLIVDSDREGRGFSREAAHASRFEAWAPRTSICRGLRSKQRRTRVSVPHLLFQRSMAPHHFALKLTSVAVFDGWQARRHPHLNPPHFNPPNFHPAPDFRI
jgi:hypothetical protein